MDDRVLVFDLDDTLYLERDFVQSGFREIEDFMNTESQINGVGDYAWALLELGIRGDTFNRVIKHFDLPEFLVSIFVDRYRNHVPKINLLPDSLELLRTARELGISTAMITDGYAPGQRKKISALDLEQFIDYIVVTGEHGTEWTKPSELPFLSIQQKFPSKADFTYYGDNPTKDFQSPNRLGWTSIRVRRVGGLYSTLESDVLIDSDIPDLSVSIYNLRATRENRFGLMNDNQLMESRDTSRMFRRSDRT